MGGLYFTDKLKELEDLKCDEFLDLMGQELDTNDISLLVERLDVIEGEPLKHLSLADNSLSDEAIEVLAKHLKKHPIAEVDLDGNCLTSKSAMYLKDCHIECLNLSSNCIQDTGARILSEARYISTLYLRNCGITVSGALKLLECENLKHLHLDGNYLKGFENCIPSLNHEIELVISQYNYNLDKGALADACRGKAILRERGWEYFSLEFFLVKSDIFG